MTLVKLKLMKKKQFIYMKGFIFYSFIRYYKNAKKPLSFL